MLVIFSSSPFYTSHVCLPTAHYPIPPQIYNNPKFWPYFKDAIGALDGCYIHSAPPALEWPLCWNRKGFCSQNCLFCCNFALQFVYAVTGLEGSATDAHIYKDAWVHDLHIPAGKYYLANAGFPLCNELLVPHRNICYHLTEWGHANVRWVFHSISRSCCTKII